ncbi:Gfo/Idh/MocA family oxidoreductase [Nocardioides marmoribigeumensis]|uniref:Dehydrogenase n=1 Tax=Nocardioides marmoribigeumensis TaxID=433649 RepID=A0ABU2BPL9_9ACTN|nr:Gfo/Idh/MocA family oxidoreductase [Nocardioides marmoribigeumensis]MDR7360567.1 putative dehydrogenase [Nocardioides marmoribigeumensis]
MAELRAGLIGLGQMGRHHSRVLRQLAGVDLVAIVDPHVPADQRPDDVRFCDSIEEMLEVGVDLCVVATPTQTHLRVGLQLAAAGVHTMVEKPVAADVDAAATLAKAFADRGLVGCVGHIERFNPSLQELRKRLAHGELGELYQVATRRQGPFPARIADVGVILDLATHDIDSTAWVTGRSYTSVAARTAHRSGREHEDLVAAVAGLEGGVVANHIVNWLSPLKERVTVVSGERGSFVADTVSADLTFFANGVQPVAWDTMQSFQGVVQGDMIRYAIAKPEPLVVELQAFRDAVLGERNDVVTMQEASDVVLVATAMKESARIGTTQQL